MSIEELRDELDVEQEDIEQDEATENEPEAEDLPDDDDNDESDGDEPEATDDEDNPADELGFSFDDGDGEDGDPYAGQPAPEWVKQVRKENRELKRKLKELGEVNQQPALREKPTLEDFDYDSEAFEQELLAWHNEKQQYEQQVKAEQAKYQQYDERYKTSVDAVRTKAADYDEIEETIADVLPPAKQAMIKMMCDNPAQMVYSLGKSPQTLAELSEMDDPQFIKRLVLLEQKMSQSKPKSRNPNKPKPKSHELTGSAGGGDTQLAKLEAEAERTGDRSKVVAYKRSMRQKS